MEHRDFDDPAVLQRWLDDTAINVVAYLRSQNIEFTGSPALRWNVAPMVSLWMVLRKAGSTCAAWVICGDLPSDWIEGEPDEMPCAVVHRLATRFQQAAKMMLGGGVHPIVRIGDPDNARQQQELGALLAKRAALLLDWTRSPEIW